MANDDIFHLLGRVISSRYSGDHFLITLEEGPSAVYQMHAESELPQGMYVPLCIKEGVDLSVIHSD
jgi:hypothetical protein